MIPTQGTVVAERFRLIRLLGQGGMGSVWTAHHIGLDVPCAVKFIHAEAAQSADIRARFEREARAAAQLRSPHVVQILDHGVWEGSPYIAMEYLEGEDLDHRLKRVGRLDFREIIAIFNQIARALAKAHAAGLVHRDLKPANIFLAKDDDREIAKVLDFGIAKSNAPGLGDSNTKTGSVLGTPYYMSPEQAQGTRVVDHRADLWSFAVIAFECVTGQLPFQSEAFGDLLMKIMVQPLPIPTQVAPNVPPAFDTWWARAAQRDPTLRFQTAKEMTEALSMALAVDIRGGHDFKSTAEAGTPERFFSGTGRGSNRPPPLGHPSSPSWSGGYPAQQQGGPDPSNPSWSGGYPAQQQGGPPPGYGHPLSQSGGTGGGGTVALPSQPPPGMPPGANTGSPLTVTTPKAAKSSAGLIVAILGVLVVVGGGVGAYLAFGRGASTAAAATESPADAPSAAADTPSAAPAETSAPTPSAEPAAEASAEPAEAPSAEPAAEASTEPAGETAHPGRGHHDKGGGKRGGGHAAPPPAPPKQGPPGKRPDFGI